MLFIAAGTFYTVHSVSADDTPKPNVKAGSATKLVFSDEFNGNTLDRKKWNTCYDNYNTQLKGCTNYGNNESEWYKSEQVSQSNGNLVLTAIKKDTEGLDNNGNQKTYPYASGMVSSGGFTTKTPPKWSGTNGYYVARIKSPSGQAVWPAFWLLPTDQDWPPEIDIMEVLGNKPNDLLTTYFWKKSDGSAAKDSTMHVSNTSLADSWHTYAVRWQNGQIDWYLDGKIVKHVESENVPTKKMQVILDLAIGGQLPGYPDNSTPTKSQMLVDYVRVYQ